MFSAQSRFSQRICRRYADELALLPAGEPVLSSLRSCFDALISKGYDTGAALRILRNLVVQRLIHLDCDENAPLSTVTSAVTLLAEFALDIAINKAFSQLDERFGKPLADDGTRARLWIMGMGKLGARELNVSSDIDLIYVYDKDGTTSGNSRGAGKIGVNEYFARAVKIVYSLIGDVTEHGFVFRVDLALRPNGNSGATVCSLDALEEYFLVQGREWERFAWMKSRCVAPREFIKDGSAAALRSVVLPFVFRKYLDYNIFESLRSLHAQIRSFAGSEKRASDVKLGRGGIREIEFTVQLLQVVRGGQFPELRTRPSLEALQRLAKAGLMPQEMADKLSDAYIFLRKVEHRIQYLDDLQTHMLPSDEGDLAFIAGSMEFKNTQEFLNTLNAHRDIVAGEFERLLGAGDKKKDESVKTTSEISSNAASLVNLQALQVNQSTLKGAISLFATEDIFKSLSEWISSERMQNISDSAGQKLVKLLQKTAHLLADGKIPSSSIIPFTGWLEQMLKRESYLSLLLERQQVLERLLGVIGASSWLAKYASRHPSVIDELASNALFARRFNPQEFISNLNLRKAALTLTHEVDEESLLNLIRRAHHSEMFATLARDVQGKISVEQAADDLSALADAVLEICSSWCWQFIKKRHKDLPEFGIIAYGKLGGKELGYGSDLDLVFVYDDDESECAPEVYFAFVRKLITWLTTQTGEGDLYEIDTALRPNGGSGLLVTSFTAYADYQENRGSNTAWTWEHQAMTRARILNFAPADLINRFNKVRHSVISAKRDKAALNTQIKEMRERMRAANPVHPDKFDLKQSRGAMIDAEFATQFLILANSHNHPELEPNLGNIAILNLAEKAGLLPAGIGSGAADAYRILRKAQHLARLNDSKTVFDNQTFKNEQNAIIKLYEFVFEN